MVASKRGVRYWVYRQLDPRARPGKGLSRLNIALVVLILLAVIMAILETEPTLTDSYGGFFERMEWVLGVIFAVEYLLRLWVCVEDPDFGPGWRGRMKFIVSLTALIDLVVVAASFAPAGDGALLLRFWRLMRIVRLAKLGRMTRAWAHITTAVHSRRAELLLSFYAGLVVMVVSSTFLYFIEGAAQPDKFGSIPRALWWAVATLTTIGYGDVFPITPLGRIFAAITALTSIGVIAMPTGILAAAFSDAVQRHRETELAEIEEHQGIERGADPL